MLLAKASEDGDVLLVGWLVLFLVWGLFAKLSRWLGAILAIPFLILAVVLYIQMKTQS